MAQSLGLLLIKQSREGWGNVYHMWFTGRMGVNSCILPIHLFRMDARSSPDFMTCIGLI